MSDTIFTINDKAVSIGELTGCIHKVFSDLKIENDDLYGDKLKLEQEVQKLNQRVVELESERETIRRYEDNIRNKYDLSPDVSFGDLAKYRINIMEVVETWSKTSALQDVQITELTARAEKAEKREKVLKDKLTSVLVGWNGGLADQIRDVIVGSGEGKN